MYIDKATCRKDFYALVMSYPSLTKFIMEQGDNFEKRSFLKNDRSVDLFYYGCNYVTLQSFLLNKM